MVMAESDIRETISCELKVCMCIHHTKDHQST